MTGSRRLIASASFPPISREQAARLALLITFMLMFFCGNSSRAQDAFPDCSLKKGVYNCKVEALKAAVSSAKTFRFQSAPRDRVGASQLQAFGVSLGKSLALASQPADLTFVLASTENGGVNYGSMDRELATVKVYAGGRSEGEPSLVWVESLSGQPDVPWAQVVRRVLDQLRANLK